MNKSRWFLVGMPALLLVFGAALALTFGACNNPTASGGNTPESLPDPFDLTNVVKAPVKGAEPPAEIDTDYYEGTIKWRNGDGSSFSGRLFAPSTAYGAVLALTAKDGFSFDNVTAGDFTHDDSESVTIEEEASETTITITIIFEATKANTPDSPDVTAPAEVSDLAAKPGDGMVTLTWTNPADEYLAFVEISWTPGDGTDNVDKGTQTYPVRGLVNGTEYTFTLKAVDTAGNESAEVSITATPLVLLSYLDLTEMVIAPVKGEEPTKEIDTGQYTGTVAWRKVDGSSFNGNFVAGTKYKATLTLKAKEGFIFTGVEADSFVHTRAISVIFEADEDLAGGTVTITFPDTEAFASVSDLVATPGNGQVTFTWNDPAEANLASIEISHNRNSGGPPDIVPKGTQTYTARGLVNGTEYTFTFRAVDTAGIKDARVTITVTPNAPVSVLDLTELVIAPVRGEAPNTTTIDTDQYTGTVAWRKGDGSSFNGNFVAGMAYQAVLTLTAKKGFTFNNVGANGFVHIEATSVTFEANSGTVTITFPKTEELASVSDLVATPGNGEVMLAWINPADAEMASIEISWTPGGGPPATVGKNEQLYTAENLANGTEYTFTVTVVGNDTKNEKYRGAEKKVKATPGAPVSGVSLDKTSYTLAVGGRGGSTVTLMATVTPTNALNKDVTWTSSSPAVATVDEGGTVTAAAVGETIITATSKDGGKIAFCNVTVTYVSGISLDRTSLALMTGDTMTLIATVEPADDANKAVTWTSSSPAVATVDEGGTVTALAPGTALISVVALNGSFVHCEVTVTGIQAP